MQTMLTLVHHVFVRLLESVHPSVYTLIVTVLRMIPVLDLQHIRLRYERGQ